MKKTCLLCSSLGPLTREHRIKSSLLEYFNSFQNSSPEKELKFYDGSEEGGVFKNIKRAGNLRPKKNICSDCNSSRSTDCDMHFDEFVKAQYHWQFRVPEIQEMKSPTKDAIDAKMENLKNNLITPVEDTLWMYFDLYVNAKYLITDRYQLYTHGGNDILLKRYLAKHTICYFDRSNILYPDELREVFMSGRRLELLNYTVFFLPTDFQHGYLNTVVRFPESRIEYAIIFSNIAIHVDVPNPQK